VFLTLFVILLVMWLLGFFAFHIAGGSIHLLSPSINNRRRWGI